MWAALLVSLAKTIPAFRDIYETSVALFYANEESQDQNQMNEIQIEREAIVASLKSGGLSDVQKRIFRKRLIALSGR